LPKSKEIVGAEEKIYKQKLAKRRSRKDLEMRFEEGNNGIAGNICANNKGMRREHADAVGPKKKLRRLLEIQLKESGGNEGEGEIDGNLTKDGVGKGEGENS